MVLLLEWIKQPEAWLVLALVLLCIEIVTGIFFAGAFCMGAFATAIILFALTRIGAEIPQHVGLAVGLWGGFSLLSCVVLWCLYNRRKGKSEDLERPYDGEGR